jgi:hypothetical protein
MTCTSWGRAGRVIYTVIARDRMFNFARFPNYLRISRGVAIRRLTLSVWVIVFHIAVGSTQSDADDRVTAPNGY